LVFEDSLAKWGRLRPSPPPPRAHSEATAVELKQQRAQEWEDWLAAHLAVERENLVAGLGAAFGEARAELRDRIAALELRVDALTAELTKLRGIDAGTIIDLPPLLRKRSDGL
jgi:hypothetical protein